MSERHAHCKDLGQRNFPFNVKAAPQLCVGYRQTLVDPVKWDLLFLRVLFCVQNSGSRKLYEVVALTLNGKNLNIKYLNYGIRRAQQLKQLCMPSTACPTGTKRKQH